jgi:hypothetical protein
VGGIDLIDWKLSLIADGCMIMAGIIDGTGYTGVVLLWRP